MNIDYEPQTEEEILIAESFWVEDGILDEATVVGTVGLGSAIVGLAAIYRWAKEKKAGCRKRCVNYGGDNKRVCIAECMKKISDEKKKKIEAAKARSKK